MVGHFLACICAVERPTGSTKCVRKQATFRVGRRNRKTQVWDFAKYSGCPWGLSHYFEREYVLNECDASGNLTLKIDLQVDILAIKSAWKPKANLKGTLKKLYTSKKGTDFTFVVDGVEIPAHKTILAMLQSELQSLIENSSDAQVYIEGADPRLFETMIRFHYTQDLPSDFKDKQDAVNLLKLADKYGVVNLKMLLEARIVESKVVLSPESCVNILLLSESHNCALLREAAMSMLVGNMQHIIETGGLGELAHSPDLMKDVMIYQANQYHDTPFCGQTWSVGPS